MRFAQGHSNSEPFERRQSIRHQPFAARFVNWRALSIRDNHSEPALPRGNRRCQSRWPAANYEHIS
jgi:hypothetical protein